MADRALNLPSLLPRGHELARRMGLAGFWAWWIAQLDPLVPAAPRAALAHRRMRPVLLFEGDHATLWRPVLEQGARLALQGIAQAQHSRLPFRDERIVAHLVDRFAHLPAVFAVARPRSQAHALWSAR